MPVVHPALHQDFDGTQKPSNSDHNENGAPHDTGARQIFGVTGTGDIDHAKNKPQQSDASKAEGEKQSDQRRDDHAKIRETGNNRRCAALVTEDGRGVFHGNAETLPHWVEPANRFNQIDR